MTAGACSAASRAPEGGPRTEGARIAPRGPHRGPGARCHRWGKREGRRRPFTWRADRPAPQQRRRRRPAWPEGRQPRLRSRWARVLDANVLGPARVIEAFVENVAKGRDKRIVTVTSRMGSIEDNSSGGSYAYRSSKAGVMLPAMKSFSIDLAPRGITCVVVHPGWVRTDMGGAGGKLTPAESVKSLRSLIESLRKKDSGNLSDYRRPAAALVVRATAKRGC